MPLYELYRMAREKLDSKDLNSTHASDQSSAPENDFFELVWENGQISMQGQPSRAKKSPTCKSLPSHSARIRDKDMGNGTNTRVGKFGDLDSGLNEIPMSVPSGEVDLSPDEDMVPWLNYSIDDYLQHEYNSDLLHELSRDTVNQIPASENFSLMDKRHNCNQELRDCHRNPVRDFSTTEQGIISREFSVGEVETTRTKTGPNELYPPSLQQCQTSFASVRSRVSVITDNNTSNATQHVSCGETTQIPSTSSGFANLKMQKHDPITPSTSSTSTIMNFSHFARPAAIMRANLQSIGKMSGLSLARSESIVNKNKDAAATSNNPLESTLVGSRSELPRDTNMHCQQEMESSKADLKPVELKSLEQNAAASKQFDIACKKDALKDDQTSNIVLGESGTKGHTAVEKGIEQVVASSSVCSGNGVERVSDSSNQNLKRKSIDTEDSECHSEDVEEESVGVKKAAPARGNTGSKRSRAAEVHNLSERVDKASMLDEAIEYLKTLQLQVQMMSMGAGLYMPPMMLPPGMQHMHSPMSPFLPMGVGMQMGLGMGYGMAMPDMNGGSSRFPTIQMPQMQGTHLSAPPMSGPTAQHGMARSNPQVFGLPGQGLPVPMTRTPIIPLSGGPLMNSSALGLNVRGTAIPVENMDSASASGLKDPMSTVNSQVVQSTDGCNPTSQMSTQHQATNVGLKESALAHNSGHSSDADDKGALNPGKEDNFKTICFDVVIASSSFFSSLDAKVSLTGSLAAGAISSTFVSASAFSSFSLSSSAA
ncbi:transcription factor PIF3-like [Senna tora]|uniref:Transcription factor PIF3-like n=1 Tax=Senna tora TaxID=362788 RepID=A0A834SJS8_9FABA|nr:transcription factor PIF3-like [Senna tora]